MNQINKYFQNKVKTANANNKKIYSYILYMKFDAG